MSRDLGHGIRDSVRLTSHAFRLTALLVAAFLVIGRPAALGETKGAVLVKQPKPLYPEDLAKGLRQGNVVLIGRIDAAGKVQDIRTIAASHDKFVAPAIAAVRAWEFRPAMRDGKPVEIAANIGVRFRLEGDKRGEISRPILGDLAVFPADAAGNRSGPEGFPIRRGADPRLRVEPVLDVTPQEKARTLSLSVQAVSPAGRVISVYEGTVALPAKAKEIRIPFNVRVGPDWEDGVWMLRFSVDKADAGGGQFWLAGDPARFNFGEALAKKS